MDYEIVSPTDVSSPNPALRNIEDADQRLGSDELVAHDRRTAVRVPVLLLKQYQYHACEVWARSTPVVDAYRAPDHWQWMATLWRGIVGPDLTVFIRDCNPEEMPQNGKIVQVAEGLRCIIVRRLVGKDRLDEPTLRRVSFEVGEWASSMPEREAERLRRSTEAAVSAKMAANAARAGV